MVLITSERTGFGDLILAAGSLLRRRIDHDRRLRRGLIVVDYKGRLRRGLMVVDYKRRLRRGLIVVDYKRRLRCGLIVVSISGGFG